MRTARGRVTHVRRVVAVTAVTATLAILGLGEGTASADVAWPPTPTTISGSGEDSDAPQIASLGGDDAVAVWETCSCSGGAVKAAVWNGASWSAPQMISDATPGIVSSEPQVAGTSPGHAVAIWTADDSTTATTMASTYDGTAWAPPVAISTGAPFPPPATGSVSGAADGSAVAVWPADDGSAVAIEANVFDGTSWLGPSPMGDADQANGDPQVATTGSGRAVAVWENSPSCSCSGVIQSNSYDGIGWGTPTDLSDPSVDATAPVVTAIGGGDAVAAWTGDTGAAVLVQATTYDGTSWSGVIDDVSSPSEDVSFFFGSPQITSTGTGAATVAWIGADSTQTVVHGAAFTNGAWAAPVDLSAPGGGVIDYTFPDITTVEPGVALAVWAAGDGTAFGIQASTYDGSTPTPAVNVAPTSDGAFSPQVAGTGEGTAVTVWASVEGLTSIVQGARGTPTSVTKPVAGGTVRISTASGGIVHAKSTAVPTTPLPPAGLQFPYGMLAFDVVNLVPGASASITLTLPGPVTQYWKLQHDTWQQLTTAAFHGNQVTFTLTDGGTGDADGVANGTIVDPSAPVTVLALPPLTFTG